jgi:hypothetical protein
LREGGDRSRHGLGSDEQAAERRPPDRQVGCRFDEGRRYGRENERLRLDQLGDDRGEDTAATESTFQPLAGPVESAAEGRFAYTQSACGEIVALPLEAAEDQRRTERLGQPPDLVLDGLVRPGLFRS